MRYDDSARVRSSLTSGCRPVTIWRASRLPAPSVQSTPGIGVVVLSQHTDESYARALFNDGSAGLAYLLKDRVGDLEDLVRALHEVASGGSVVDPLIIDTLVARQQTRASSPLASLTPRELDVLREMAQGKTNAGIEQALFLSESTVEKHVNAIFTKLGISAAPVHRRIVAVLAFLENAAHDSIAVLADASANTALTRGTPSKRRMKSRTRSVLRTLASGSLVECPWTQTR
jgi:DNA-binding NarL/FixJ family response regulator